MNGEHHAGRATERLLWALVILVVFGVGFGPVWVTTQNAKAELEVTCAVVTTSIRELEATRLLLEADALIAADLGLPIAEDLQRYVDDFVISGVPEECGEVS